MILSDLEAVGCTSPPPEIKHNSGAPRYSLVCCRVKRPHLCFFVGDDQEKFSKLSKLVGRNKKY